jgi:hypothetical protein
VTCVLVMRVCPSAISDNSFGPGTSQFSAGEEHRKLKCEELTCDVKTLCVL